MVDPIFGNAPQLGAAQGGWFAGHFMPQELPLLQRTDMELKWGEHSKGDSRTDWTEPEPGHSLSLLIRGNFLLLFPQQRFHLRKQGDFVIWGPGSTHSWEALEDSLILTIRWPSLPPDPPTIQTDL